MLSTISKVKKHIGIPQANTAKDEMIGNILLGVSAAIEQHCNRKFGFAEFTDTFIDVGAQSLFTRNYPIAEVTEIKMGKHVIDHEALIDNDELIIEDESGELLKTTGWDSDLIRITYTAGYLLPSDESGEESGGGVESLPGDIELAAIRMAARIYERRTAEGVGSASPGSFSANYNSQLDEDIKETLASHRKYA